MLLYQGLCNTKPLFFRIPINRAFGLYLIPTFQESHLAHTPPNITALLHSWTDGDASSLNELFPLIYEELNRTARHYLQNERANHTLQPTALVNEVFLRLEASNDLGFQSRLQFFAFSAQVMRRILVEYARKRNRTKRGGEDKIQVSLDMDVSQDGPEPVAVLALDQALTRLREVDERKSCIVEMWYFAGLRADDVASLMNISAVTVRRELRAAKCWLAFQLQPSKGGAIA